MKLLIINGPNLNMLGLREPDIYGKKDFKALTEYLENYCAERSIDCKLFQSNHEGAIVDEIQAAYGVFDAILINPAAYTHTSVAILDALKAVALPAAEVHLSNIYEREEFRHHSFVSAACVKTVYGKGFDGYGEAIDFLKDYIEKR